MVISIWLCQAFSCKWVGIAVLDIKTFGILPFILPKLFIIRKQLIVLYIFNILGFINRSVNKCNILDSQAAV